MELDFKMLTLASETKDLITSSYTILGEISIYARTNEINCHYLMTLFCGVQFKSEVKLR